MVVLTELILATRRRAPTSRCQGGNREEFATPWVTEQPDWSAIREYAYGHGQLHIENSTHALWQWVRDDDPWNPAPKTSIGDQAYFVRQQSHLHGVDRC